MKTRRHAKILEIINSRPVETQDELQRLLCEDGYNVTQATVSRDIKELRLIKTPAAGGGYRYSVARSERQEISTKFHAIFANSVTDVQYAQNIVVVHCATRHGAGGLRGHGLAALAAGDRYTGRG